MVLKFSCLSPRQLYGPFIAIEIIVNIYILCSLIKTKFFLPWEAPVKWYIKRIIGFMLLICTLKYALWTSSDLYSVNAFK